MIPVFEYAKNRIVEINAKGGPVEADYFQLDRWIRSAYHHGPTPEEALEIFGPELCNPKSQSLFSRIVFRPRGYAGSFDIMHDIYNQTIKPTTSQLQMTWDAFILAQISGLAVRHRMVEFRDAVALAMDSTKCRDTTTILDVACGSGVASTVVGNMKARLKYLGVDQDPDAVAFGKSHANPCNSEFKRLRFLGINEERVGLHDLVWCSGLFDYISGRSGFINAATRLVGVARKYVVIGNMGPYNPSRAFMEVCGWKLEYRTRAELAYMGSELGKLERVKSTWVTTDPTGIQHYLYIEVEK